MESTSVTTFLIWGLLFFSSVPAHSTICRQKLEDAGADNGGGGLAPDNLLFSEKDLGFLPHTTNPYGHGIPREAHEVEREGQLYPAGEAFKARYDESGNVRKDGRYLFAVARDTQGLRRVMVVPRFDFERNDGKYLSTHRSMFRKHAEVFGPNPAIEVMGELEIRKGTVVAYNNKAGTAFDLREATRPQLFEARKNIAVSMGIDLSHSQRVVNYAAFESLDPSQQNRALGRHLREEVYVESVLAMRAHPLTKAVLNKFEDLTQRAYALFPELEDPLDFINLKSPYLDAYEMPAERMAIMRTRISVAQEDSPVVLLSASLLSNEKGAHEFAKDLDDFEQLIKYAEAKKTNSKNTPVNWKAEKGELVQLNEKHLAPAESVAFQALRKRIMELNGYTYDPIESAQFPKVGSWFISTHQKHFLNVEDYTTLLNTQKLLDQMLDRYPAHTGMEARLDFEKFSKELKLTEEDLGINEEVAKKMLFDLHLESLKKGGDPVALFDEFRKRAENAHEDDMYDNPRPEIVVNTFMRAMGINPSSETSP